MIFPSQMQAGFWFVWELVSWCLGAATALILVALLLGLVAWALGLLTERRG